jgi:uncharacterized protein YqeY
VSLKARIQQDTHAAMRSGDKPRVGALRMALAGIKQREVDSQTTLDDAGVIAVLEKMIKQGRDALEQFKSGGRADLVAKESAEIAVFEQYLPARMSDAEIDALIAEVIAATGAQGPKDMGKVMAALKAKVQGRADMSAVSARVREVLSAH